MAKKIYAFMLMGETLDPKAHRAVFETDTSTSYIITVNSLDDALAELPALLEKGVGAIELCGGFKAEGARKIIEATGGDVAVGYVTRFSEQDPLFTNFFTSDY